MGGKKKSSDDQKDVPFASPAKSMDQMSSHPLRALQFRFRERSNYLKRKNSQSQCDLLNSGGSGISNKKKRRQKGEKAIIHLPTRFLLGGNIADPLNLASFSGEVPQDTPKSSPLPTPKHKKEIEVLIPANMHDPLNLSGDFLDTGSSPVKIKGKRKKKRKRTDSECTIDEEDKADVLDRNSATTCTKEVDEQARKNATFTVPASSCATATSAASSSATMTTTTAAQVIHHPHHVNISSDSSWKRAERERIVSPAVPQGPPLSFRQCQFFGLKTKRNKRKDRGGGRGKSMGDKNKHYRDKDKRFRYGNYDRYYQYRNVGQVPDSRLSCMKADWFQGKEVLDIGCNAGTLTIAVAKYFRPKLVIGIDIDDQLIHDARIRVSKTVPSDPDLRFPDSLTVCHGPLVPTAATASIPFASAAAATSTAATSPSSSALALPDPSDPVFPNNIFFATANYVLDHDDLLSSVTEEYDTILCMSVTKWIHLNWGDEGLQRTFKRMFRQLRPGGRLILEPQSWTSYVKKHSVCPETDATFRNIRFRPEKFTDFLLSKDVGFSSCELVDTPHNESQGFRRPIFCFTKNGSVSHS